MPYFDLHCHPSLKPMFSAATNFPNCWDNITLSLDSLFGNVLDSQSSLSQIAQTPTNLVVVALHAVEKSITEQQLLRFFARLEHTKMSRHRLEELSSRPYKDAESEYTYYSLLHEEVDNLLKNSHNSTNSKHIKILKSYAEYDPNDNDTLHIILAVEGSHCFWGMENVDDYIYNVDVNKMVNRLEEFTAQYSLLYITLTHLMPNKYFNHAYGLKIFDKKAFLPQGDGITDDGRFFIGQCYENNVLVDIKHMSLKARKDFYAYHNEFYKDKPIVASHMAVTGISWNQISGIVDHYVKYPGHKFINVTYNLPKGHFGQTSFNPSSINLYDEEIVEIVKSNGIIGLILDERVLGDYKTDGYSEYISWQERTLFINDATHERALADDTDFSTIAINEEEYNELYKINRGGRIAKHTDIMFNNIFHIVKTIMWYNDTLFAGQPKVNEWDYICLGTDFDGLINPVDFCLNYTQIGEIEKVLVNNLQAYANKIGIVLTDTPQNIAKKIMYENGKRFIAKNFV